jgi:hypothetical protein
MPVLEKTIAQGMLKTQIAKRARVRCSLQNSGLLFLIGKRGNSARARLDAAMIVRRAAEEQYASEQRQFRAGTSTMFLFFRRQISYISARNGEVRARADLAEAIANMNRATARTLEAHQIKIRQ